MGVACGISVQCGTGGWHGRPAREPTWAGCPCHKCISTHGQDARATNVREPEWPCRGLHHRQPAVSGREPYPAGAWERLRRAELFALYEGRVPAFADLCCYSVREGLCPHHRRRQCRRAGLLATQGIRGGANREVLKRIKESGDIFWAESDRPWILDGANVHVSMVGFDDGEEQSRILDGNLVATINANLTSCADITTAAILAENRGICFMGPSPKAPFDIDAETAAVMLADKGNPNGRPNADVVRPVVSAVDIAQGSRGMWTIDFGVMPIGEAAQYEKPFEYVKANVLPVRETRRDDYRGM